MTRLLGLGQILAADGTVFDKVLPGRGGRAVAAAMPRAERVAVDRLTAAMGQRAGKAAEEDRDWLTWRLDRSVLTQGNESWIRWEERIVDAGGRGDLDALTHMVFAGSTEADLLARRGNSYGHRIGRLLRATIAKVEADKERERAEHEAAKVAEHDWMDALTEAAD